MGAAGNTELFQRRVDDVMGEWLSRKPTPERLERVTFMLGLRYVAYNNGWKVVPEYDMAPERELIVIQSLLTLLHRYDPSSLMSQEISWVILGGLSRRDRWRSCLKHESSAYEFAILAAHLFDRGEILTMHTEKHDIFMRINRDLELMLGGEPPVDTTPQSRAKSLFGKLFGEAWAHFMDIRGPDTLIADLIATTRPSFMPGLLPQGVDQDALALPAIDGCTL